MKQLFLTFTLLVVATSFAQKLSGKVSGLIISKPEYSMNDSIIRVVYSKPRFNFTKKPAIYINGVLAKEINLLTMNSNEIESMNIEKEEIEKASKNGEFNKPTNFKNLIEFYKNQKYNFPDYRQNFIDFPQSPIWDQIICFGL